jgi:iron donor protein CyaY
MNEPEFEALAAKTLTALAEAVEDAGADVELEGGILTIVSDDDRTFLLNKHAPLQQLWYSSPISGAHHYAPRGADWLSTRDGTSLLARLSEELAAAGIDAALKAA